MVQGEDTISALIKFKADFGQATKSLEEYLNTTNSKVTSLETKLANMLGQKSKTSLETIKNYKLELDTLYKQQAVIAEQLKLQKKRDSSATDRVNMLTRNMEGELKLNEQGSKKFTSTLKSRLSEEASLTADFNKRILGFNNIVEQAHKKSAENEIATERATVRVTRAIRKEEFDNKQKQLEKEAKDNARAYSKTLGGAITEGTTFGHKFATTAQYMAAGTALYGLASAFTAAGQAALEADLNMRTMSAVMKLNIAQASALDEKVRNLGETYGGTTSEIEQVAIALGRAGVKSADIVKSTEIVLAMARLTGDTFEQSTNAVISYQQVFGNTTSIQTLGDKLAYVANVSRLSTQDIGTFSNYALAAAKDVGLTEDAVGGLAAAFSNAGVNASTIGTQIRRFTTLLTDDSKAVDSFFRSIGVNQANLLASFQAGGETSNNALREFVKTISKVDKATFTNLTGQMDILAANSLQLMRNNATNIDKYIADLQTGVTGQLENTKVILASYIVTFESMWNGLKNYGIKAIESQSDALTEASIMYNSIFGDEKKALLGRLSLEQKHNDQWLEDKRSMWEAGKIGLDEWNRAQQNAARTSDVITTRTKQLTGGAISNTIKAKEQVVKDLDAQIASQVALLSDPGSVGEAQVKLYEDLTKQREELVKTNNEVKSSNATTSISATLSYENQLKYANALMDAKKDSSTSEKIFWEQVNKLQANNTNEIYNQINTLSKYSSVYQDTLDTVTSAGTDPAKMIDNINSKLSNINETVQKSGRTDAIDKQVNVLQKALGIAEESLKAEKAGIDLTAKKDSIAEAAKRKLQEAADKALRAKEKEVNLGDRNEKALASMAELQAQLTGETELTLGKAESKFAIDTQLVGLAYDQYVAAKGTRQEKEKEALFNEATVTYLKSSLGYVTKINEHEDKRKALSLELNSSLEQATETEEVRLGIIEKATDSEYEKLRVKIEQAKIDKTLTDAEIAGLELKLAKLKQYQGQRKNVHTLAMEYQRQIAEQEEMGYIAAKAGLESLESGMSNFFDVTSDGWLEWHSLATSVLNSIYKQLLEQLVIKQLVSGIAGGIGSMFAPTATAGANLGSTAGANNSLLGIQGSSTMFNANGGMLPSKGYASGGMLSGGTGIRDDIYLGNVEGTRVFAMGGEFITRKSSVNDETKGTLDYINKTGTTPNQGTQVAIPVSINIENQTGQPISADMIEAMTKPNDKGEYEKVVSIILKASQTDPRVRGMLKGGR